MRQPRTTLLRAPIEIPSGDGLLSIGSGPDDDLQLPRTACGPAAALLLLRGAEGVLIDGGLGESYVHGHRIDPHDAQVVRPGDRVRVGRQELRLETTALALPTRPLPPASLLVVAGPERGRRIFLRGGPQQLGRCGHAEHGLRDRHISGRHARVTLRGLEAIVTDLGSKNGLYLGSRRLVGEASLRPGDELTLGRTVLRFEDPLGSRRAEGPLRASGLRAFFRRLLLTGSTFDGARSAVRPAELRALANAHARVTPKRGGSSLFHRGRRAASAASSSR